MRKSIRILLTIGLLLALVGIMAALGWYWYDTHVDRGGWVEAGGTYYYKDFRGNYVSGWQEIEGCRYYFSPENNAMATYWQEVEGKLRYFSGDGTLDTGFWDIGGKRYYLEPDGTAHVGWLEYGQNRYYFDQEGAMVTSWCDIDGKRYHFRGNGIPDTGLVKIGGEEYRFLEDGSLYTGWDSREEGMVYYLPEGPKATGWQEIEGKRYYFGSDGLMRTGWLRQGGDSYYLQPDGSMAVGPTEIEGQTYYFSPGGIHIILVNENNPVPDYYTMELKTVEGWNQVSTVCYAPLVRMLADCRREGIEVTFNSAYRSVKQQQAILDKRTQENMDRGASETEAYAKARETVALPGRSEHHLGLAVDLLGEEAIAWLNEHCWEYGFIVRYRAEKADITGIIDEPWHFRYVGVKAAMELKDSGLCLEEYLGAVE